MYRTVLHVEGVLTGSSADRYEDPSRPLQKSALGKWGHRQMGSDGFNRILPPRPREGTACTRRASGTRDFKGFQPDFNRILT